MSPRKLLGAAALAGALLAAPAPAWACPSCARNGGNTAARYLALGAMILLPFGIAAVIVPAIRRGPESR